MEGIINRRIFKEEALVTHSCLTWEETKQPPQHHRSPPKQLHTSGMLVGQENSPSLSSGGLSRSFDPYTSPKDGCNPAIHG